MAALAAILEIFKQYLLPNCKSEDAKFGRRHYGGMES